MTSVELDTQERVSAVSLIYDDPLDNLREIGEGFAEALRVIYKENEIDFSFRQSPRSIITDEVDLVRGERADLVFAMTNDAKANSDVHRETERIVNEGRASLVVVISNEPVSELDDWLFALFEQCYRMPDGNEYSYARVAHFVRGMGVSELHTDEDKLINTVIHIAQETLNNQQRLRDMGIRF